VILFDETIRQKSRDGRGFVEVLEQRIFPGIKVDKGTKAMANFPGEKPRVTASNKNRRV